MFNMRLSLIFLVTVLCLGCGSGNGEGLPDGSSRDASLADGGMDGGTDGGPLFCDEQEARGGQMGGTCRGLELLCDPGLTCLFEQTASVGGPSDPIVDLPPGEDEPFDTVLFPGNYCSIPLTGSVGTCTAEEEAACNAECGRCTPFFVDADVCLRACLPTDTDNSICRDGYKCDLVLQACDVECTSDADCLVFREDTNENGEFDPYDPDAGTGDRLVWDTESNRFCNLSTYRCEHPGTPGAEAGIVCTDDEDCEAKGDCLFEDPFGFPGGYCTKFRCDLDGRECAGDGFCQTRGFGVPVCAEGCKVATGAVAGQPETYLDNTQGCREGYTCLWNGIDDETAATNGACVPGVYNDQTVNNVGDACDTNDECYSPLGQGVCDPDFGCTVAECFAPGTPDDICGDDNSCLAIQGDPVCGAGCCFRGCELAADCPDGDACVTVDGDPPVSICFAFCGSTEECRPDEVCTVDNECVPTG